MTEKLPDFDKLWDYDKAVETEKKFLELLPQAIASGDMAHLAELLSQIGRAKGLQGNFDEAHKSLDEAEALVKPDMERAKVRVLLERGRLYNSAKKAEKSIRYFTEAMQLASEAKEDYYAVDAAHMLGIAAPEAERSVWNLKALAMAEASEDERAQGWKDSLYNNIGYSYMEEGKYAEAMNLFEKLLDYTTKKGDKGFSNIARWFIAKTHRLMGDTKKALADQQALEKTYDDASKPDAYVYEELGEIYLALVEDEPRRKYFALAHELFHSDEQYNYIVKFEQERLDRIKELSK